MNQDTVIKRGTFNYKNINNTISISIPLTYKDLYFKNFKGQDYILAEQAEVESLFWGNREKFDLNYFNLHKDKYEGATSTDYILQADSVTILRLHEHSDGTYQKDEHHVNSPFNTKELYYKSSLRLKKITKLFHDNPLYTVDYDEAGNFVEDKDFTLDYGFSLDMLRDTVLKDYNIDIFDLTTHKSYVTRGTEPQPYYFVQIPNKHDATAQRIKYDATTGQTIGIWEIQMWGCGMNK